MIHDPRKNGRLIALFLVGLVLFNYPILSLFNRPLDVFGIPVLYLYIFFAWCLIIGLIVIATNTRDRLPTGESDNYRD